MPPTIYIIQAKCKKFNPHTKKIMPEAPLTGPRYQTAFLCLAHVVFRRALRRYKSGNLLQRGYKNVSRETILLRIFVARQDVRADVLPRHFGLHHMGGAYEQSALGAGDIQIAEHDVPYILRRAKGHGRLRA